MNKHQKSAPSPRPNVIFGIHPVIEAMTAGSSLDKIFVKQGNDHTRIREIRDQAQKLGVPVQYVPEEKLQRLVRDREARHQGIVALMSAVPYQSLEPVILKLEEAGKIPLIVMLDGVTDVRNFGAIARTAECMGAHALVVPASGSASLNADAIKTSAGALHHLPVCREHNLVDCIMLMQAYNIRSVACTEKASENIFGQDFSQPTCLIFGSEERGISDTLLRRTDALAAIPLQGEVASLNVSVAAGMVLLEASRQRGTVAEIPKE